MSAARLRVLQARAHPELVVIAHDLVPRNRGIDASGIEGLLVVDAGSTQMNARAGGNDFAVEGVNKPAEFVVLRVIRGITQREAEVERRHLMPRVKLGR